MATVLILANDGMIGGLLGQLTDLTGHAAQFRSNGEELDAAVYSAMPDVVLMDAGYDAAAVDQVATAAADVRASVVYFSPVLPVAELRQRALERHSKYFPLPAGPSLLARILSAALAERRLHFCTDNLAIAQHAVAAALVAVTRAQMLVERSSATRMVSRALRSERDVALGICRRSYAALREAVIAYTRELRSLGFPPDRTLELVKQSIRGEIDGAAPVATAHRELDDAVEWCLQTYYVA